MVYQNDKPSPDTQQPNLLTWSFERQPRHEKRHRKKAYAMTCTKNRLQKQVFANQPRYSISNTQEREEGGKPPKNPLSELADTIITQLQKRD